MIGAVITAITSLLFGIIIGILAFMFLNGKCNNLVAGYNDMTEEEKKTSAEVNARMNGKTLMIVSVLTLLYSVFSVLSVLEILSTTAFVVSTIIYGILFVSIVIISVARFVKKNI
ncbi:MAG: DUF3784 domain-containing protein [Huintestinicola sp.]